MKAGQTQTNRVVRGMSILIALLFAFNLLSVIPTSENHPKDNGITHTIATELADLAHSPDKQVHDHVEHCGMSSCTIALSHFNDTSIRIDEIKTRFLITETKLTSLHHAPPGRPPLI